LTILIYHLYLKVLLRLCFRWRCLEPQNELHLWVPGRKLNCINVGESAKDVQLSFLRYVRGIS